jgi:hypothetical protein
MFYYLRSGYLNPTLTAGLFQPVIVGAITAINGVPRVEIIIV